MADNPYARRDLVKHIPKGIEYASSNLKPVFITFCGEMVVDPKYITYYRDIDVCLTCIDALESKK